MYATYLNQMRSRVATNVLKNWDEAAEATGRAIRQSDVDELMNAINVFTGRGNLPLGLDRITKPLSAVFWAPKLLASRFQAPLLAARGTVEGSAGVAARLFDL